VLVVAPGSIRTNVSRNALNGDGSARGVSDKAIDNGIAPETAAAQIITGVENSARELVIAEGAEAAIAGLRRTDPDALFDRMSAMVQAGYANKMAAHNAV
jgi:dehydrogenase/reductase SDR family member 7B